MKELLRKLKEIGIYIKNGAVFSINQIKKQDEPTKWAMVGVDIYVCLIICGFFMEFVKFVFCGFVIYFLIYYALKLGETHFQKKEKK